MDRKNYFWGFLFIIIGVGALINSVLGYRLFSISDFWPFFIILLGLSFEASYFISRRSPGVLVPGGILTTIGILFLFETFTHWRFAGSTWPVYTLAVAIGLFQLYLFDGRKPGLLIPVFILSAVSGISFASIMFGNIFYWLRAGYIAPIVFIAIGIYILVKNFRR